MFSEELKKDLELLPPKHFLPGALDKCVISN